jgi:DnaJ-class molecular chaperone
MTRPSNYFKAYTVVNEGVMQEQVCPVCKGIGEDPRTPGADCIECWGEGTLELPQAA